MITTIPKLEKPVEMLLAALGKTFETQTVEKEKEAEPHKITFESVLANEFEKNPEILAGGFPYLFPHRIPKLRLTRTGGLKQSVVSKLIKFYDGRFAGDCTFTFYLFMVL